MTLRNYSSTAAETTLSGGVDASTTTLTVSSTTGFPAAPFVLAIDAGAGAQELVLVTNVAGTTLTVTRAFDSTVASAHDTGAVVAHSHAAIDFREANVHVNAEAGVHGATGDVVGTTDEQTLTNKTLEDPTVNDGTFSDPVINEGALRLGHWQAYVPVVTGWTSPTVVFARYAVIGKTCHVVLKVTAAGVQSAGTVTLPVTTTAAFVTALSLSSTTQAALPAIAEGTPSATLVLTFEIA